MKSFEDILDLSNRYSIQTLPQEVVSYIDSFIIKNSVNNISLQNIVKSFRNINEQSKLRISLNPNRLYESKFSEDFEIVSKQLRSTFGLQKWQTDIADMNDTDTTQVIVRYAKTGLFDIIIPYINKNTDFLNEFMDARGFTLIYYKFETYDKHEPPYTFVHMIYTQKYQNDIKNDILKYKVLYHLTVEENIESIKKNGLIPHKRESINDISYDERTYFFTGNKSAIFLEEYLDTLRLDYSEHKTFYLVIVNLFKLPQNIEFFYDPLLDKEAVYTKDVIPPSAIIGIRKMEDS